MTTSLQNLSVLFWIFAISIAGSRHTAAQSIPPLLNYQGKIVGSGGLPIASGDYEIRFRIWDAAAGGNLVWGPQVFNNQIGPGFGPKVPVVQGSLNTMLGPVDANGASILSAFNGTNRFLEIQIANDPPLSLRQQLLSAPYAIRADSAAKADVATVAQLAQSAAVAQSVSGLVTTSPIQYYVATNGNDTNDGLTIATAKLTIQSAINLIPNRIEHQVEIRISPGTYRELVTIRGKTVVSPGYIYLKGMGVSPDAVQISGADNQGVPTRNCALIVEESNVAGQNLSFTDSTGAGALVSSRSQLYLTSCKFLRNFNNGMEVNIMSFVSMEDCVFRCDGQRGGYGLYIGQNSAVSFRDDHRIQNGDSGIPAFIGDPNNLIHNTFENFNVGISVNTGGIASHARDGGVVFTNNGNAITEVDGGRAP